MLKNNIELDVKVKCIENGISQVQIAEDINTTKSYVNRIIKKQEGIVNKTFVQIMETLGYDIELTYIKRRSYILGGKIKYVVIVCCFVIFICCFDINTCQNRN